MASRETQHSESRDLEDVLKEIYYNVKNPSAYTGVEAVYQEAKKFDITRRQVREWLEKQYTYSMHKPIRKNFPRRKIYVHAIDEQWQIDLADMTQLRRYNDGFQYLLTVIDIYSKFAWVIPVKNKGGQEVARALEGIFKEGRVPKKIQSDKGKEFINRIVQELLTRYNVKFFTSQDPTIKCAVVERFNRTIKGRIWKYFSRSRTYRYIHVLADLVKGYNNSKHRSIGTTPALISVGSLVPHTQVISSTRVPHQIPKLTVGQRVRIGRNKSVFEKGYLPNWTEELFTITQSLPTQPPVYKLKDYYGEPIAGTFYEQELQPFETEEYWVEKVIKKRGDMALVKWLGYREPEWVPLKDIETRSG